MALLAEQLVEEWLHGRGYFTLRGLKLGVHEADLLGVRFVDGQVEAVHVEVSISTNPVGYLCNLTAEDSKSLGLAVGSAKRRSDALVLSTAEAWVKKKFDHPSKVKAQDQLAKGVAFKKVFVHGKMNYREELDHIERLGVEVIPFEKVISEIPYGKFRTGGVGADISAILGFV